MAFADIQEVKVMVGRKKSVQVAEFLYVYTIGVWMCVWMDEWQAFLKCNGVP